jgi:nucleotide-binding universal stress UspA family protein
MKKILIPTDLSSNASNAISYAFQLFRNSNVQFYILHVDHLIIDMPTSSIEFMSPTTYPDLVSQKKMVEKQILKIIKNLNIKDDNFNYEIENEIGFAGDVIVSKAQELNCDFIVMGTKGATGLSQFFIGSVTASVIRKSDISVLAIPENFTFEKLEKIVFATDYEGISNKKTLQPLFELARIFDAKVMMFHAIEAKEPIAAYIEELQVWKAEKNFHHVKHTNSIATCENIPDGILDFAGENEADLIAIIPHTYNFFENLLHKSVSKQIAFESKTPILALH